MSEKRDGGPAFSVQLIDEHLENILRASGSSLRHYSLASIKDAMRKAMADAMIAAREEKT